MRALAIVHLKYWLRISSILKRTKNSTKTSNTLFERSGSGLFKSWRIRAWHSYWPAMPTLYDKLNFLGEDGLAGPLCYHYQGFQMTYCTLLCEPVILVKGKSFVTLYTDFSFQQLKEKASVQEFSFLLKGKCFWD